MKRIFVPTSSSDDWKPLLSRPDLHWKPGYSAKSAAKCWEKNAPKLPNKIIDLLEASKEEALKKLELLAALPEWKVPLPGGSRPSQTDILALTRNKNGLVILGVEAKADESFGLTIGEWKKRVSDGRTERINYLERELGCSSPLNDNIRYQLLHRTVSTLLVAQDFHAHIAVMLVQSFSSTNQGHDDFEAFANALAVSRITVDLYELKREKSPRLLIGWCKEE